MKSKHIFIISCIFLLAIKSNAQTIIFHEDLPNDNTKILWGANRKHFAHFYIGCNFFANTNNNNLKINHFNSYNFPIGLRYKLKLTNFLAIGIDISSNNYIWNLSDKLLPSEDNYDKIKLKVNDLGFESYIRINFTKHGNYIGKFIDIGASTNITIHTAYKTKKNLPKNSITKKQTEKLTKLDFIDAYTYNLKARLGFNNIVFMASYRLNNLFKDTKIEQLPPLSIGLQCGLHK